ncbi:MAG: hypothetical protein IH991_06775 [Planctomycetes bacterium]|nr:hypothetical protein [Planctomycetota bacterium]
MAGMVIASNANQIIHRNRQPLRARGIAVDDRPPGVQQIDGHRAGVEQLC